MSDVDVKIQAAFVTGAMPCMLRVRKRPVTEQGLLVAANLGACQALG